MAPTERGERSKQDAIVRAATTLFRRYGFRKTSVDLIAREAEVAKPTLYAHFADKEAIFVAVCQHVMNGILAAATAALDAPDVIARIAGVVAAKFTTVFELVDSSPHARELLDSQAAQARTIVERADAAFVKLLVDALRAAARAGELTLEPGAAQLTRLAQLLMQAGHGAGYGATTASEHRAHVEALVAALLASMRAPAAPKKRARLQ
jgi:AcrR family transcriptional regulator